jgi:NADPH:quinone reductase-like Zn-dependent oxidoreductase
VRAAVLTTPGEPPAYAEHPDPLPDGGCTVVRVTAAPIVPLDLLCAGQARWRGV